jgi:hypothetical protein
MIVFDLTIDEPCRSVAGSEHVQTAFQAFQTNWLIAFYMADPYHRSV